MRLYQPDDFNNRYASGSGAPDAMIVCPCTIGTVGHLAAGLNNNLVHRAAGVMLKEKRPLVLVVRESPLSLVDLRNLVTLSEAGAIIMPAAPVLLQPAREPRRNGRLLRRPRPRPNRLPRRPPRPLWQLIRGLSPNCPTLAAHPPNCASNSVAVPELAHITQIFLPMVSHQPSPPPKPCYLRIHSCRSVSSKELGRPREACDGERGVQHYHPRGTGTSGGAGAGGAGGTAGGGRGQRGRPHRVREDDVNQ